MKTGYRGPTQGIAHGNCETHAAATGGTYGVSEHGFPDPPFPMRRLRLRRRPPQSDGTTHPSKCEMFSRVVGGVGVRCKCIATYRDGRLRSNRFTSGTPLTVRAGRMVILPLAGVRN